MSRADIVQVTTLAAHLAIQDQHSDHVTLDLAHTMAKEYAADAMLLQRLSRNIRAKAVYMERIRWGTYLMNMCEKAERILKPYGLVGVLSPTGIRIDGLPGNALGADGGFQI